MSVRTQSRTHTHDVIKPLLILPDEYIEMLSGEKDDILEKTEKLAPLLDIPVDMNLY